MTCAHAWPAELTPDAECLHGCGLAYADWSEADRSHEASSLVNTTESRYHP